MNRATPEAEQRAALVALGYDPSKVVAQRGHHCLYAMRGETCPGPERCTTLAMPADLANPCDGNGERDGYLCTSCGRWAETIADIAHRLATCVPYVGPARRRRS